MTSQTPDIQTILERLEKPMRQTPEVNRAVLGSVLLAITLPSMVLAAKMPQFKARVVCEKGEQTKAVLAALDSNQVIGRVACNEEVIVLNPIFGLAEADGALFMEPKESQSYSPTNHHFLTHITFGKQNREGWLGGSVKLLPNQRYQIVIVGRAVNKDVCDSHGGYQRTEPAAESDPLGLFKRSIVCKDGVRIPE